MNKLLVWTQNQTKIIQLFHKTYFSNSLSNQRKTTITLADFLSKTKTEQIVFIKSWAQQKYQELLSLEQNLNSQLQRVQQLKQTFNRALTEWQNIQ